MLEAIDEGWKSGVCEVEIIACWGGTKIIFLVNISHQRKSLAEFVD